MKKALLALAVAGATLSAQADTKLYGHVAYNIRDTDGVDDITYDAHGFSGSRFGFAFSKKLKNGLKVLLDQEFGLAAAGGAVTVRRQAFGFSGGFGKVTLGYHSDVGDGVINADLAGTNLVNPLSSNTAAAAGVGVNGFDPGSAEALRYFSPKLGGIATIGVQYQENGESEIALKMNASGFRFNAFAEQRDTADDKNGFLVGYKAPFGLSLTYVQSTDGDNDHSGIKLGYAMGKHKFSVSKVTLETDGSSVEPESTGISYLYSMAKGVELWAGYKERDSDTGDSADDEEAIALGGRVKF